MVKVEIVKGTLTNTKADVVVNSCNQALSLSYGGISKSFVKAAGPGLQDECSEKYPNGICFGDIAVTKSHKLKFKAIYHIAMPPWDCKFADASQILCLTVCACLKQANSDGMASIAFPALGCGFLDYPHAKSAEIMHNCIVSFNRDSMDPALKFVYIVIWPKGGEWKHIKQTFDQEFIYYELVERPRPLAGELKGLSDSLKRPSPKQDFLSTCVRETDRNACKKVLECGHICCGYRGEPSCLPCLSPDCVTDGQHQTSQDDCIICYTDHLDAAPVIMTKCGHIFHLHCAKRILQNKWVGPKINFNFTKCPICKEILEHKELTGLMRRIEALQDDVRQKAMLRLQFDHLERCKEITNPGSKYYQKPQEYAMDRYIYYLCFKCKKPYFGGTTRAECGAAEEEEQFKPEDLVCPGCRGYVARARQVTDSDVAKVVHNKENRRARQIIKSTTKPCPHCGVNTEKNGGCMHMTCAKCKMDWCWKCCKHWEERCQRTHWFG